VNAIVTAMAPLPLSIWIRDASRPLPFPLREPGCRLFARARHGLWHGLMAASLKPGDEVLVPAYHHGSEIEALVRAGARCRFYEANETLEPDEAELGRLLERRTRALHLTHFLGFPQDAARWRAWCDERGLLLIEDAAQAWLAERDGRPVGSDGDLAIYCLYKTFGLPDGAALLSRLPLTTRGARRRLAAGSLGLEHAAWLLARSSLLSQIAKRVPREQRYSAARDFALGEPASTPSTATLLALPRVACAEAAAQRRYNYGQLLRVMSALVPSAFRRIPAGASPFVLPIATIEKPEMLRRLRARGIRPLDFWSIPHPALPVDEFPGAAALRASIIGLPVHQELRSSDLQLIVAIFRDEYRAAV